ncbi:hypothetical protein FF1_003184 [Malus domestica]
MGPAQSHEDHIDDYELKALKLKYASPSSFFLVASTAQGLNAIKLYLHVGDTTLKAKWIVSEKIAYSFFKTSNVDNDLEYDDDKKIDREEEWFPKVGLKVRARVSIDFVSNGVWALIKFYIDEQYQMFVMEFQDYLFENVYRRLEAMDENKVKVYGKDFLG